MSFLVQSATSDSRMGSLNMRHRPPAPIVGILGLVVLAAAGATGDRGEGSATARGQDPPELRDPDYVGKLVGEPHGRVLMRIDRWPDGTPKLIFQAQHIRNICEDGNYEVTIAKFPDNVSRRGRWESLFDAGPADSFQNQEFSLMTGRFLRGGQAKGYIFRMTENFDPGSSNADDCWSDGVVRWKARRVKDGTRAEFDRGPIRARPIEPGRYEGEVPGHGKVSFELRKRDGRFVLTFGARLELTCETSPRMKKLGPYKVRPYGRGHFDRPIFVQRERSKDRVFTWINGRVKPNGEATGRFVHFDDPWDPDGEANVDECVTPHVFEWQATRTDRHSRR